jgi:GlpG protein
MDHMPDDFDYSTPRRPRWQVALDNAPYVTYVLCGLCVLLTTAFFTSSEYGDRLWYILGHVADPAVNSVEDGRYDVLVTSMFLHANVLHILFNLSWLYPLGRILELSVGRLRYLLFVIASAAVGSCVEILVGGGPGIGASGVVYALFGLLWAGRGSYESWRLVATRRNLQIFVAWGVFCLIATEARWMNIANGAHAGGFLFGLCIGHLFFAPRRRPIWAAPLIGLLIACVLSLTYMPWSADWTFDAGLRAMQRHDGPSAIYWFQRNLNQGGETDADLQMIQSVWEAMADDAGQRRDRAAFESDSREADDAGKRVKDWEAKHPEDHDQ